MKSSPFRKGKVDVYISATDSEEPRKVRTSAWLYTEDVEGKYELQLAVHRHVYIDTDWKAHVSSNLWTVTEVHSGSYIITRVLSRVEAVRNASERIAAAAANQGINVYERVFKAAVKNSDTPVYTEV